MITIYNKKTGKPYEVHEIDAREQIKNGIATDKPTKNTKKPIKKSIPIEVVEETIEAVEEVFSEEDEIIEKPRRIKKRK